MELLNQLLILGVLSYPASISMRIGLKMKLVKDLADKGLKYNGDRIDYSSLYNMKNIPILNMMNMLYEATKYNRNKEAIIESNILDKMNKVEEQIYESKPNSVTAFLIANNLVSVKVSTNVEDEETKEIVEAIKEDLKDLETKESTPAYIRREVDKPKTLGRSKKR
jgi:hypothetical protein